MRENIQQELKQELDSVIQFTNPEEYSFESDGRIIIHDSSSDLAAELEEWETHFETEYLYFPEPPDYLDVLLGI